MFEIIFGSIWTLMVAIMTFLFYFAPEAAIRVNGEEVSQEVFSAMLGPKILFAIFWAIGLFMLFSGLKKVIKNAFTNTNGEPCFGRICDIYKSGAYVNGIPELKADILVYIPSINETQVISEIIGFDSFKYPKGSYVQLKYYNGDINFIGYANQETIPLLIQDELAKLPTIDTTPDEIPNDSIVDGVEYVRKEPTEENNINDSIKYL